MDVLSRCTLFLAFLSYCSRAQDLNLRENNMKYFIHTPENISIASSEVFGIFRCGTRSGYAPHWVINNAHSVASIQNSSGYGSTNDEHHLLQGEDNILSFLSIPASELTNNSIVVCEAIQGGERVAVSDPAYMVVLQTKLVELEHINTTIELVELEHINTTSDLPESSSTIPGTGSTPHQKKVLSVEWIAGLIVAACLVCGLVTLLVFAGAVVIIQRRQRSEGMEEFRRVIKENNYWRRDNQVFPTTAADSADFKEQNSLPQKQTC